MCAALSSTEMPLAQLNQEAWDMFMRPGIREIKQARKEIGAISLEFGYSVPSILSIFKRI